MKFRYFSTQRPFGPGTFPQKDGRETIVNFNEKIYCEEIGREAWGYIDYNEPLNDTEIEEYELKPNKWEFTVKFNPDNEQLQRIYNLFLKWCEYIAEDGTKPFAEYTLEKFFEVMMQSGSYHTMNHHIENMEYELMQD